MDNLTVIGRAEQVSGAQAYKQPGPPTKVTFWFDVYPYSMAGRGFIICFKCRFRHFKTNFSSKRLKLVAHFEFVLT